MEKIVKYAHPWRTKDSAPAEAELKQIICDNFADRNKGGIGVWVVGPEGVMQLKAFVGLKKYTSDPSSVFLTLFGYHYGFVDDIKDGTREINKFNWGCLASSIEVNVFKEKNNKTKLYNNLTVVILSPVKDDDAQQETISVRNAMYIPFCLMSLVLDKDLNPRGAFLLLYNTINAAKLTCCQGLLDFCRVTGTFAKDGDLLPVVARDMAGNVTAVSIG